MALPTRRAPVSNPSRTALVWLIGAAFTVTTLGACRERADAPLEPVVGLQAPGYREGAAQVKAEFGRSRVVFSNDDPRTCAATSSDGLLRFSLSVGPEQIGTSRAEDRVRLTTGPIGRRHGQDGYEAVTETQDIQGDVAQGTDGAGGWVRFAPDLGSGVAFVGSDDHRVKITFGC